MSAAGSPKRYLLIISKPPTALDHKALQMLQAAPEAIKADVTVGETTVPQLTPIWRDQYVNTPYEPGQPTVDILARTFGLVSGGGQQPGNKQASQAAQRRRLLESFMTGAAPARPAAAAPGQPQMVGMPTMHAPPRAMMPSSSTPSSTMPMAPPAMHHVEADPEYFSGGKAGGSIGTQVSDMFVSKDLQATDIVPRDPPTEVLQRMRMRTADFLMNQFGALDQKTDVAIETQIDDRVKNTSESTMGMGR